MTERQTKQQDASAAARKHDAAQMREILDRKHAQDRQRAAEPPLTDDPAIPSSEDPLADEATGRRGSTGGIRNMGGGHS